MVVKGKAPLTPRRGEQDNSFRAQMNINYQKIKS
jgi:hypothetical protein